VSEDDLVVDEKLAGIINATQRPPSEKPVNQVWPVSQKPLSPLSLPASATHPIWFMVTIERAYLCLSGGTDIAVLGIVLVRNFIVKIGFYLATFRRLGIAMPVLLFVLLG
jgi:hypothetical protein